MMCGPALWGLGRLRDVYPIYRSYIVTVMRDAAYVTGHTHRRPHRTGYSVHLHRYRLYRGLIG